MNDHIYKFKAQLNSGKELSLKKFSGKVLLVVNTASKCKYTAQYEGLEKIYKKYKGQIEILAFPCNQFGLQEPAGDKEINAFCQLNYHTSFPLFKKTKVNGDNAHPLFQFLQNSLPGIFGTKKIKWNFTKFLIDKNGNPQKRFAPNVDPKQLEKDIELLLNK